MSPSMSNRHTTNASPTDQSHSDAINSSIPFPTLYTASSLFDIKTKHYSHSHTWPPPSSDTYTYRSTSDSHDSQTPSLPPFIPPPPLDLTLTLRTTAPASSQRERGHVRSPAESFSSTHSGQTHSQSRSHSYARQTRPSLSPVAEETSSTGSRSPTSPSRTNRDSSVAVYGHGQVQGRRHRGSRLSTSEVNQHRISSNGWFVDQGEGIDSSNNGRGFLTFEEDLTRAMMAISPPHVHRVRPDRPRRRGLRLRVPSRLKVRRSQSTREARVRGAGAGRQGGGESGLRRVAVRIMQMVVCRRSKGESDRKSWSSWR